MDDEPDPKDLPPSKSQLKRDASALQQLGVALLEIPEQDWLTLDLPDTLVATLRETRQMPSHGARKRQLQFIGKLMRSIDPEPIHAYFEQRRPGGRRQAQQLHALERWRDRLIEQGDDAINACLDEYPAADRQRLRQLVRQARKEQSGDRPPKSSRALFRYLRDIDTA